MLALLIAFSDYPGSTEPAAGFFSMSPTDAQLLVAIVTITLFVGVLLVVAGAVVGFVVEWLIDEAYRRNREQRRRRRMAAISWRTTARFLRRPRLSLVPRS